MKYAHLEGNKILGWYTKDIHDVIPTPNVEVEDSFWRKALSENYNCYEDGVFSHKDLRSEEEREEDQKSYFRSRRKRIFEVVDHAINKKEDIGEDASSLRAYRQALRESTDTYILPTPPEGFNWE